MDLASFEGGVHISILGVSQDILLKNVLSNDFNDKFPVFFIF